MLAAAVHYAETSRHGWVPARAHARDTRVATWPLVSVRALATPDGVDRMTCAHVQQLEAVTPSGAGCKECLETGGRWVQLRLCLTCGHVGCCDSSPNRHATRHHRETAHPVVRSFEPGEEWLWCYADQELIPRATA